VTRAKAALEGVVCWRLARAYTATNSPQSPSDRKTPEPRAEGGRPGIRRDASRLSGSTGPGEGRPGGGRARLAPRRAVPARQSEQPHHAEEAMELLADTPVRPLTSRPLGPAAPELRRPTSPGPGTSRSMRQA